MRDHDAAVFIVPKNEQQMKRIGFIGCAAYVHRISDDDGRFSYFRQLQFSRA